MNDTQMTEIERYQIKAYLMKAGYTQQAIAIGLNRSASTISRELKRATPDYEDIDLNKLRG